MRLKELSDKIETIFTQLGFQTIYHQDPYSTWNQRTAKYPSISIPLTSITSNESTTTYGFRLYAGNRLQEGFKNELDCIDGSWVRVETGLRSLDLDKEIIEVVIDRVYTPFTQQFSDIIAGVYIDIEITVPNEIDCEDLITED